MQSHACLILGLLSIGIAATASGADDSHRDVPITHSIEGKVIVIGIPRVSALSPVGTFLPGGPVHDIPALAALTVPGAVLEPSRLLIASTSNFGAPVADADQLSGSLLSVATNARLPIIVPPEFAAAGGQVVA